VNQWSWNITQNIKKRNTSTLFHFLGMTHSWPAWTLFEWCSHSVDVLWGANSFNTITFLLNSWAGLFKVVYPHLYGMSWQHFTVSMNPEFLAKFTFQTEWYSRPRHLAALFSFPAHAKNRKTPLPNHPIHWQTLYICNNLIRIRVSLIWKLSGTPD
jgi:hypothetical protein